MSTSTIRYLTKSRFKLAVECPTKLYYTGKDVYRNASADDEFLKALAEGGFQVGELAKLMFPEGIEVTDKDQEEQIRQTEELLRQENVTIFEGTIRHGKLLARVDVLRKRGNTVELIEVKAKSFDSTDAAGFRTKKGGIDTGMLPYLQDIAFQRHVFGLAFPKLDVTCQLLMADKSKACSVDGLNQMFKIRREGRRPVVEVAAQARNGGTGASVLTCVGVDGYVDEILDGELETPGAPAGATLAELAQVWSHSYDKDQRIPPVAGAHCGRCEFRDDAPAAGVQSGFHECWNMAFNLTAQDIAKGTVLDLWNFRQKEKLIAEGLVTLGAITRERLGGNPGTEGLSRSDRQWMQISGEWEGGGNFFLDRALMRDESTGWEYPLHFIDFETARVALPYFAGQRPYENIAFQFSHHSMQADGTVAHENEFLITTPGHRPNYDFVRALKQALGDAGTIFMWSPHENTTLNAILKELLEDAQPPVDRDALIAFLRSVTRRKIDKNNVEAGPRAMVDLCKLAERAFFHPAMRGSCSIKKVLPAVLQSSEHLRERYSHPIYGVAGGVRSLNFRDKTWRVEKNGVVCDPYKLLPQVFSDITNDELDIEEFDEFGEIQQGGAATTAYARLQFDDVAAARRTGVEKALKRYCELDTLAMVMIFEAWQEWIH